MKITKKITFLLTCVSYAPSAYSIHVLDHILRPFTGTPVTMLRYLPQSTRKAAGLQGAPENAQLTDQQKQNYRKSFMHLIGWRYCYRILNDAQLREQVRKDISNFLGSDISQEKKEQKITFLYEEWDRQFKEFGAEKTMWVSSLLTAVVLEAIGIGMFIGAYKLGKYFNTLIPSGNPTASGSVEYTPRIASNSWKYCLGVQGLGGSGIVIAGGSLIPIIYSLWRTPKKSDQSAERLKKVKAIVEETIAAYVSQQAVRTAVTAIGAFTEQLAATVNKVVENQAANKEIHEQVTMTASKEQ